MSRARQQWDAHARRWAYAEARQQGADLTAWAARERSELAGLDHRGKRAALERLGVRVYVNRPGDVLGPWSLEITPPGSTSMPCGGAKTSATA